MVIEQSTQNSARPATRDAQVLGQLVSARVFGPHAFFFVSGEDEFFPNCVEKSSGFVINRHGDVWSFWTGWDADQGEVKLTEWETVSPLESWLEDEEYQLAREAVGLPV